MNDYTQKSVRYKKKYMEVLGKLYGTKENASYFTEVKRSQKNAVMVAGGQKIEPSVNLSRLKGRKKRNYPEYQEQVKLVAWLRQRGIWCNASPNAARRSVQEGERLKALGMSAGFPDVEIPIMRGGYGGLYIEMKPKEGGKVQPNQFAWQAYLRRQGYMCEIAHGFEAAKEIVVKYLSL